jgi:hypothetical protein
MTPEESASIARGGSPETVDEPNDIAPDGAGVDSMRGREHSDGQAGVPFCTPHLLGVACVGNTGVLTPNIRCPRTISVRLADISVLLAALAEH